ncbi:MAG: hypothetical protein QM608_18925 [Caulobacter sp.]
MTNKILALLVLGAALAVLKAAAIVLVVALLLSLLFAFIERPGDTLALLACLGLLGLVGAHPLACIVTLGVAGIVVLARRPSGRRPLINVREHH